LWNCPQHRENKISACWHWAVYGIGQSRGFYRVVAFLTLFIGAVYISIANLILNPTIDLSLSENMLILVSNLRSDVKCMKINWFFILLRVTLPRYSVISDTDVLV